MTDLCEKCIHFSKNIQNQYQKQSQSYWDIIADGICDHWFFGKCANSKPPHPMISTGHCFDFEKRLKNYGNTN